MKKYLYFNYFRDKNPGRHAEYSLCVKQNFEHQWIDGYKIFLEDQDHATDLPQDSRIEIIPLSRRMEFRDVIDHAHKYLEPNSVVIIINLDIYLFGPHWQHIDRDFFSQGHAHKAMVCTRFNLQANTDPGKKIFDIESLNWYKGDFCDAYVLATPFAPGFITEDLEFRVGNAPQCDNLMMFLMQRYYHTYSWGSKYQIVHVDICRGLDYQGKIFATKENADNRARVRQHEHINIPTQQPWQQLLDSGREPTWTWTWFDFSRTQ